MIYIYIYIYIYTPQSGSICVTQLLVSRQTTSNADVPNAARDILSTRSIQKDYLKSACLKLPRLVSSIIVSRKTITNHAAVAESLGHLELPDRLGFITDTCKCNIICLAIQGGQGLLPRQNDLWQCFLSEAPPPRAVSVSRIHKDYVRNQKATLAHAVSVSNIQKDQIK